MGGGIGGGRICERKKSTMCIERQEGRVSKVRWQICSDESNEE